MKEYRQEVKDVLTHQANFKYLITLDQELLLCCVIPAEGVVEDTLRYYSDVYKINDDLSKVHEDIIATARDINDNKIRPMIENKNSNKFTPEESEYILKTYKEIEKNAKNVIEEHISNAIRDELHLKIHTLGLTEEATRVNAIYILWQKYQKERGVKNDQK